MNTFVTALLFASSLGCLKCEEIKYELSVTTPDYNYEKSQLSKEVVTSKERAFSITILNDVPVLRVGMLQISPNTHYFWMHNHKLQEIEPGAFDNQNITTEILLERNNLTVIRSGTFKNLKIEKLNLAYNSITHIEENAITDMPNLWEVHLSRNKIALFHDNSFVNTPKMWTFDMSYNKLTKVGARWFSFMKKDGTVIVGVAYNEIDEIDPKAFEGITVWNLGLDHNKLKSIPEEVFTGNDLQLLGLENNQLETLPAAIYEQKNFTDVNITENPLRCDVQKMLKAFNEKLGFFTPVFFYDRTSQDDAAHFALIEEIQKKQAAQKPRGRVLYDSTC